MFIGLKIIDWFATSIEVTIVLVRTQQQQITPFIHLK